MFTVYLRRTPDNRVYIGCTSLTLEKRAYLGYGNTEFQDAIDRFGWDSIETEVLAVTPDPAEAKRLESHFIQQYNSLDPEFGYNRKDSGYSMSGPRRIALSRKIKKHWESPEALEKMKSSIAESRKSPEYRKKVSDAIKKKWRTGDYAQRVSAGMKKRYENPEVRQKASDSSKAYWSDAEHRKQHSIIMKEAMNKPETRQKVLDSRKRIDYHSEAMRAGRKACGEANRGRVSVHRVSGNSVENRKIKPEELQEYLSSGWETGWITNGPGICVSRFEGGVLIKKRASPEELPNLLDNGWKRGWKGK